ncbi:MAG: hypothetical protein E6R03_00385, partial [Hyphomicrobiaceae bacterium]
MNDLRRAALREFQKAVAEVNARADDVMSAFAERTPVESDHVIDWEVWPSRSAVESDHSIGWQVMSIEGALQRGKYRCVQPMLWTRVDVPAVPSRLPGGLPLPLDRVGPTSKFVSARTGWPWRQQGGDWIDADGTLHGTRPWATLPLNAASGPTARATYRVDVTSAVQHIVATGRWCALYLRSVGAPRVIAGGGSAEAPTLTVAYDDGATEVMPAHVVAQITSSSAFPNTAAAEAHLPAMIECPRPRAGVVSAQINLTVTQHWSGARPTLDVYIVDPPVNAEPVQHGIAAAQPLDAGLVGHPSVIGVHRIGDNTTLADVAETAQIPTHLRNYNALRA